MRKFRIRAGIIKMIAVLFATLSLVAIPANAFTIYSTMAEMFENSEFMVAGEVSESTLIMDPETFFVCGKLLTIKDPIFHWRDGEKTKTSSSITIAYQSVMNSQNNDVGERVLILGNTLDLSNSNIEKPALSEPFTTKIPYTGKEIVIDCSALYPDSIKYDVHFKFDITTYQLTSQTGAEEVSNKSFNVIPIRWERLVGLHDPIIAKGLRGWKTNDGRTILCMADEVCRDEVDKVQAFYGTPQNDDLAHQVAITSYEYLIDADALLDAFDAYKTQQKKN